MKEYNVKKTLLNHSQYESFLGQLRKNKAENLRKVLMGQQKLFSRKQKLKILCEQVLLPVEKTVNHSKSYSDGEFGLNCRYDMSR
jgi:hypothetical protein